MSDAGRSPRNDLGGLRIVVADVGSWGASTRTMSAAACEALCVAALRRGADVTLVSEVADPGVFGLRVVAATMTTFDRAIAKASARADVVVVASPTNGPTLGVRVTASEASPARELPDCLFDATAAGRICADAALLASFADCLWDTAAPTPICRQ